MVTPSFTSKHTCTVVAILGNTTDYSVNASSVVFEANTGPFNSVSGAVKCIEFEAVDDSIKEAEEKLKLLLTSTDPDISFCRDLAHVAIEEDPNDGNYLCTYTYLPQTFRNVYFMKR